MEEDRLLETEKGQRNNTRRRGKERKRKGERNKGEGEA
jgi:hypothetical protein